MAAFCHPSGRTLTQVRSSERAQHNLGRIVAARPTCAAVVGWAPASLPDGRELALYPDVATWADVATQAGALSCLRRPAEAT
jgi:hypothetical protein